MSVIAVANFQNYITSDKKKDLNNILQFVKNWRPENYTILDSYNDENISIVEHSIENTMKIWNEVYYPHINAYVESERNRPFDFISAFYDFIESLDYIPKDNKIFFFIQYFSAMYAMLHEYIFVWTKYEPEEDALEIIRTMHFINDDLDDDTREKSFKILNKFAKEWVDQNLSINDPIFNEGYRGDRISIAYILDKTFNNVMLDWDNSKYNFNVFSETKRSLDFISALFEFIDNLDDDKYSNLKGSATYIVDDVLNIILEYVYAWQNFISKEEAENNAHNYFCNDRIIKLSPSSVIMAEHYLYRIENTKG